MKSEQRIKADIEKLEAEITLLRLESHRIAKEEPFDMLDFLTHSEKIKPLISEVKALKGVLEGD